MSARDPRAPINTPRLWIGIAVSAACVVLVSRQRDTAAGIVFLTVQYLIGLKRLGFDVYYVEAHARTPSMLMTDEHDDASALTCNEPHRLFFVDLGKE